jgi:hypothetical protein
VTRTRLWPVVRALGRACGGLFQIALDIASPPAEWETRSLQVPRGKPAAEYRYATMYPLPAPSLGERILRFVIALPVVAAGYVFALLALVVIVLSVPLWLLSVAIGRSV